MDEMLMPLQLPTADQGRPQKAGAPHWVRTGGTCFPLLAH
jgi:hypothetical protein